MNHSDIAQICHEANRALCIAQGDYSQTVWAIAPMWQRDSALMGVQFLAKNPDAGDSATHDSWAAQKVADGWVFGAVKDVDAKTHPCLVPFDQLPPMQQAKDKLFRAVALSMLPYSA